MECLSSGKLIFPWDWCVEWKGLAGRDESKTGIPWVFQEGWAMVSALVISLAISIPHDSLSELRLPWAHGQAHSYTHVTCLKLRAHLQGKLCSWALCLSQGSCNAASLLTVTEAKKQSPSHARTPARGPHLHKLGSKLTYASMPPPTPSTAIK